MSRGRFPRLMPRQAKYLALGLMVAFLWVFLGPQPLGGRAAYVTTRGNSMEPLYSEGDLVVVQRSSRYGIGDILAYKSGTLKTIVLHRAVERENAGFVTKGDNNDWLDPDRVRSADVIGKAGFHVPGAGKFLAPLRNPGVAGALAAAVALSFLVGRKRLSRRRRDRKRGERKSGSGMNLPRIAIDSFTIRQKRALIGAGCVTALSLMLLLVTLVRPPVKGVSSGSAFTHRGSFTYVSEVDPNTVYPDGSVSTGDPIFTRVVDRLTIGFDYELGTPADASITGYTSLAARLVGGSGWSKPLLIGEPIPFGGSKATVEGTLDLAEVDRISRKVQAVTGITESAQVIEVSPTVIVQGRIGGQTINEQFAPMLALTLDSFQLKVATGEDGKDPLSVNKPGSIKASELEANNFSLLSLEIPHGVARNGSFLALLLSLVAGVALWRRFSNPAHADEPALIAAQYADWLVPVEMMRRDPQRSVHVQRFDALLRLAELYERMVLHAQNDGHHSYFIEEEGVVYYYETSESKKAATIPARPPHQAPPPPPPPPRVPRRLMESQDPQRLRSLREELRRLEAEMDRSEQVPPHER